MGWDGMTRDFHCELGPVPSHRDQSRSRPVPRRSVPAPAVSLVCDHVASVPTQVRNYVSQMGCVLFSNINDHSCNCFHFFILTTESFCSLISRCHSFLSIWISH